MLTIEHEIPREFFQVPATQLDQVLKGPTLFHLKGRLEPSIFVSVLLHGNETTGFLAVQRLLQKYDIGGGDQQLPRSLSLFVGNVAAASAGVRHLDGQPDYNRIWPGSDTSGTAEHAMMAQVVSEMQDRGLFCSIDVHNNTGHNPHYACVNFVTHRYLQLANLFSRTVVFYERPLGVQSMAFGRLTPAVTLECGRVGNSHGTDHAARYIDACLHLSELPDRPVADQDIDLFHTVATVYVPQDVQVGVDPETLELTLRSDLDSLNFRELDAGTPLASVQPGSKAGVRVVDQHGADVTASFVSISDDTLRLSQRVMPAMLTLDRRVISQDCLCYLMERYPTR